MRQLLPLRIVIPLAVVVTIVLQLIVLSLYHTLVVNKKVLGDLQYAAQTELTHFTSILMQSYQSGDMQPVEHEIIMLSTIPSIKSVQIIDDKNIVHMGYPIDLRNRPVHSTLPLEYGQHIEKTRSGNVPVYTRLHNANSFFAAAPVSPNLTTGTLATAVPYVIVLEYDVEKYGATTHAMALEAFFFISLLLTVLGILFVVYLQKFVTNRALQIIAETKSFGQGDYSLRTSVKGHDELGQIALAINQMADDVQENQIQLIESELRFRTIFESISLIALELDRNGNVVYANPYLYELTGWTQDEVVGTNWFTRFIPENERPSVEDVFTFLKNEKYTDSVRTIENTILTKHGNKLTIRWTNLLLKSFNESAMSIVSLGEDVTLKVAKDEENARRLRLESLSQLSAGIAHDFNNIFAILFGFIDLAGTSIDHKEYGLAREYIANAMTAFQRARSLSDQLLTFSKGGAPVKMSANLAEIIRTCTSFILSGSSISVTYDMPDDVPPALFDPNQIARVFENLAANARDAMHDSGTITISLRLIDTVFHITFADDGPGIPESLVSHVFDPFFTTKEFGHGLGLAAVHSIIQKHEGAITVHTEANRGTTFKLTLPFHPSQEARIQKLEKSTSLPLSGARVLLLDDEEMILKMMRISLERAGFDVVTAMDGYDAIALYQEAYSVGSSFTCAILDLTLPGGIDGRQVAREILDVDPSASLFVSSGYSDDPVMASPAEFGFKGALAKPFQFTELLALIEPFQSIR